MLAVLAHSIPNASSLCKEEAPPPGRRSQAALIRWLTASARNVKTKRQHVLFHPPQEGSLKPVIVITGASSGIGEAAARLFARRGYRVVLAARREERLRELQAEIAAAGGEALVVPTDVGVYAEITHLVAQTLAAYGQIDVLFNNAGFGRVGRLETLDPQADIAAQLDVNLRGVIWTAQAVLPHMRSRRQGQIINMSSVAGFIATPTYSVYAASKFGVRGFTEALRREVLPYGVQVSGIYPGPVRTEFSEHTRADPDGGMQSPGFVQMSAEAVAEQVWRLAQRPRRALIIPWLLRAAARLNQWLPGLVDWGAARFFGRG